VTGISALGIDVGSATVKIVGVDDAGDMRWDVLEPVQARA
jgi:activator of 2-hydroxyglutaryl-CoA dehydratase